METTEQVTISRADLEELERRAVRVNGALVRMRMAIDRGDLEAIANLRAAAQEANWTNRRALVDLGAGDSILKDAGLTSPVPDDDDDEPSLADGLSLADLAGLPMDAPE